MPWGIEWNGRRVQYSHHGNNYIIDTMERVGNVDSPDHVIVELYEAKTEHGLFKWKVAAEGHGLDGSGEIDSVELIAQPEGCKSENPIFNIVDVDDDGSE